MTKAELIEAISADTAESRSTCNRVLDSLVKAVHRAVANGEKISIPNLGVFEQTHRGPRKGRNVRTGEVIDVPASVAPKFRAGKAFKDAIPQPKTKER